METLTSSGAGFCRYLFSSIPFDNTVITPIAVAVAAAHGIVDTLHKTPVGVPLLLHSVVWSWHGIQSSMTIALSISNWCYTSEPIYQQIGDKGEGGLCAVNSHQVLSIVKLSLLMFLNIVAARIPIHCQWSKSEVRIPQQLLTPEY
ncbi:hypothetical protein GGR57DRAFT_119894 [Xylariaceae sp. FL1272]|nr:hypothetical protein GGR57DRAFT_119894 [Xylariaceae sp. FL1272]